MRDISSTLLAAQKSASGQPYVRAVFSDYYGEITRVRFNRHYTGAEGEYFHAAVGAGDGSLIRTRIDPTTKVLYTQRVASPGPGSDFSAWTSHGSVSATGAVALATHGSSVFLFYVDANNLTLRVKESTDDGASYGSATTATTAASAVTYVAASISPSGDRVLFWSEGATLYRSRYSSGAWGARTAWTNSVASLSGIACSYGVDWNVIVCGTATGSGDAKVWTAIFGDGVEQPANVWGPLAEVTTATAATNVSFLSPSLDFVHAWRLFFVEKYTGDEAYARLQWSTLASTYPFGYELWREPAPFDYLGDYGVSATARSLGGRLWLSAPAGVWSGASPSFADIDASADVVEASAELDEDSGRVRLVLRNDAKAGETGRYTGYGSGALGALQRGARLELLPGYRTSAGDEVCIGPSYWVESVEQVTGPEARLIVQARDAWWLLESWRARRQFVWAAGSTSISTILQYVASRAGISFGLTTSSDALATLEPAFTIHPGESGRTAIRRLLAMVPDVAFAQGALLLVRLPEATDDTEYSYAAPGLTQAAAHAIVATRYRDVGPEANRVRVLGAGVFSEGFDFAEIEATGERISQLSDLNLTTSPLAAGRAEYELRAAALRGRLDEIRVAGVNCAQELYDVVAVTDAQAGVVDAKRRVLGLSWRYRSAARGGDSHYDMTLRLGSP